MKKTTKKLQIKKETLRDLTSEQLAKAVGGATETLASNCCPTQIYTCPGRVTCGCPTLQTCFVC